MFNPFYYIYDWLFVNHTIDEQIDMQRLDMILLAHYKKKFSHKLNLRL
jgi:hypothetical protein